VRSFSRWELNEVISGHEDGTMFLFDLRCGLQHPVAQVKQSPYISCLQMDEYHVVVGASSMTTVWVHDDVQIQFDCIRLLFSFVIDIPRPFSHRMISLRIRENSQHLHFRCGIVSIDCQFDLFTLIKIN
jgi:hypothetical protein